MCIPWRGPTHKLIDSTGAGGKIGIGVKRYYPEHVECGGYEIFPDGCTRLVVSCLPYFCCTLHLNRWMAQRLQHSLTKHHINEFSLLGDDYEIKSADSNLGW